MVLLYYEESNKPRFSVSPVMILDYVAFDSLSTVST